MSYDGSEVLYHGANVKSFLNIEIVEIILFECNRSMHLLFDYFCGDMSRGTSELNNDNVSAHLYRFGSFLCSL